MKKFEDENFQEDMEVIVDDYSIEDWDGEDNPYEFVEVTKDEI